jgi:uncharacterized membrane-anchored protein
MNRLTLGVPLVLSLLLFGFAAQGRAAGNASGPSASGTIKEAPASAPKQSASAGASSAASLEASAPKAATSTAAPLSSAPASSPASTATSASSAAAASASTSAAPAPAPPVALTPAPAASTTTTTPLNWKAGPRDVALLDQAVIKIPQDYAYLEQDDARKFLHKLGNPNADDVIGAVSGPGGSWLVVVRFNKVGYIRDEAPQWNLDELLAALKKNVEQTNAIRKKDGMGETEIVGWIDKPSYDAKWHRLTWAVSSRDKGAKQSDFHSANVNIDALGREGYFDFNLVTDLALLEQNKKFASTVASAVVYNDGKKYSDFKKGIDKASSYNLAGLVSGSKVSAVDEESEKDAAPTESRAVRFFKIFGLIVLSILVLVGAVFGVYFLLQKRRRAALNAEEPADATEAEAPPSK